MQDLVLSKTLRLGRFEDIPAILELFREFYKTTPFAHLTYDEEKVKRTLLHGLPDRQNYVCLCSTENDIPVGLLAGAKVDHTFISEPIATEIAMFITPAYRKGKRALEMLRAYEGWAKAVGCAEATLSRLIPSDDTIGKLYLRLGYTEVEAAYRKTL